MKKYSFLHFLTTLFSYAFRMFLSIFFGVIAVFSLFFICFFIVHGIKLMFLDFPKPFKNEQEKTAVEKTTTTADPVYYIVERKKKRPRSAYGEPKEIRFR